LYEVTQPNDRHGSISSRIDPIPFALGITTDKRRSVH
jgi:hypothetical protein